MLQDVKPIRNHTPPAKSTELDQVHHSRRDATPLWGMLRVELTLLCLIATAIGCTSIRSTVLTMTHDGWVNGQSNGTHKRFGMTRPYHGVPVKLKVPAYLRITVHENAYLFDDDKTLNEFQLSYPDRWVEQKVIDAEKIFFVDFARPLSGTSSYHLQMDGQSGYFKQINAKVTDNSITDIGALVATAAPLFLAKGVDATKGNSSYALKDQLLIEQRVVAERYFDLTACDLDAQVAAFIDQHVNCGHSCDSDPSNGRCARPVAPKQCKCNGPQAQIKKTNGVGGEGAQLLAPGGKPPLAESLPSPTKKTVTNSRMVLPMPDKAMDH